MAPIRQVKVLNIKNKRRTSYIRQKWREYQKQELVMRMMSYGIEDKPRLAVAFPLAFQHVLSAFTGQIAVGMLLAMGFGLSVK